MWLVDLKKPPFISTGDSIISPWVHCCNIPRNKYVISGWNTANLCGVFSSSNLKCSHQFIKCWEAKFTAICTCLQEHIFLNDHTRAISTFVPVQVPDVLGWSSFCQDIKHSYHLEVLFSLLIGHWLLLRRKLFAPLLVLSDSFHRRQSGIVAGLVSTECVSVIGMWALTSLLDKFHFMVLCCARTVEQ